MKEKTLSKQQVQKKLQMIKSYSVSGEMSSFVVLDRDPVGPCFDHVKCNAKVCFDRTLTRSVDSTFFICPQSLYRTLYEIC